MIKFKMMIQDTDGEMIWEYGFEIGSPMMARQFCQKATAKWANVSWFKRMHLFQFENEGWHHLKSFTINSPSVKEHDRT
jgi:hypothetical protein